VQRSRINGPSKYSSKRMNSILPLTYGICFESHVPLKIRNVATRMVKNSNLCKVEFDVNRKQEKGSESISSNPTCKIDLRSDVRC
jgi:hypothetical protein